MTMPTDTVTSDPFVVQLGYLRMALKAQAADLTQSESLFQPPTGGNCVNWVLGHIVASRSRVHALVGIDAAVTVEQATELLESRRNAVPSPSRASGRRRAATAPAARRGARQRPPGQRRGRCVLHDSRRRLVA